MTIKNIKRFNTSDNEKENLIVIWVDGVKNPLEEGWTPYYGISTHNELGYLIDRNLNIPRNFINK